MQGYIHLRAPVEMAIVRGSDRTGMSSCGDSAHCEDFKGSEMEGEGFALCSWWANRACRSRRCGVGSWQGRWVAAQRLRRRLRRMSAIPLMGCGGRMPSRELHAAHPLTCSLSGSPPIECAAQREVRIGRDDGGGDRCHACWWHGVGSGNSPFSVVAFDGKNGWCLPKRQL
jgi:hypothetical protein